jgi:hypothetical protein
MAENKIQQVMLVLERSPETSLVIPLGGDRYRLASTPLGSLSDTGPCWGDIIEADFHKDGFLYVRRIAERAPLEHREYGLSRQVVESAEFGQLLREIETCGGGTEIVMGGIFWCHLPVNCSLDVDVRLKSIYEKVHGERNS